MIKKIGGGGGGGGCTLMPLVCAIERTVSMSSAYAVKTPASGREIWGDMGRYGQPTG